MVKSARLLIGATDPLEAAPGTIRGDLAVEKGRNVVHGSDSPENGVRETGAAAAAVQRRRCSGVTCCCGSGRRCTGGKAGALG